MADIVYIITEKGGRATSQVYPEYWQSERQGYDMAEESKDIELNAEQKTALLHLGLEADTAEPVDKADMLYDILNSPLPLDGPAAEMLPVPLRNLSRRVRSIAGAPITELLTSSKTSISTIETIKVYAKNSGKSAEPEDLTEVWLSVYYAAIASALIFHDRKITEHSWDHLSEAFLSLSEKDWMQKELTELLKRAETHCGHKIRQVNR